MRNKFDFKQRRPSLMMTMRDLPAGVPCALLRRSAWVSIFLCALAMPLLEARAGRGADGEYDERQSTHFQLYQDVDIDKTSGIYGTRHFERSILEILEQAYRTLDETLGMRPDQTIIVTIHDPEIFDARFAGNFRFPAAGFYGGTIHIRGSTVVTDRLIQVLYHELVHAAFDSALPFVSLPAWFNEGVAEWFEAAAIGQQGLQAWQTRYLSVLASRKQLFSFADLSHSSLGHLGPQAAQVAYLQSYGFIDFVAREKGARRLRDLCRRFIRTSDLEAAFRKLDRRGLEGMMTAYLTELREG